MKRFLPLLTIVVASCAPTAPVTADELSKLTEAIYFEDALGEPDCQIMVANVIMNRVAKKNWDDNVIDVVNAPAQFSYMSDGKPESIDDWSKYIELARIASGVLVGDIPDNTNGADHYINHDLSTATWWKDMTFITKCGKHSFYRRDWK